jgi:formate dehydrogenase subunit delta
MMNTGEKLVYMANQIGDFYKSYPHDQAVKGISEHIKKFWDPRMLKQIYQIMRQPDNGLKPYSLEAIQALSKSDPHAHADLEASG